MLRAVLCFVALTVASAGSAQTPARDNPKPTGTAVVRGRVLSVDGEQPLRRAIVTLVLATDQGKNWNALTDGNGAYELKNLPAGQFFVAASKQNFVRVVLGQQHLLGPGKPIDVAAGQVVSRVDVRLPRTGVISGHVADEFGDPIGGVQVATMRYQTTPNGRRLMAAGGMATSDEAGAFRLHGLQPGDYYLAATFRDFTMGGNDSSTAYAPIYYPGAPSPGQAQKLSVDAGTVLTEINMTLVPARALRVSGTATNSQGQPLTNARVMLVADNGVMNGPVSNAPVRPDGSFTLGGVAPGGYVLRVTATNGGAPETAAQAIVVTDDVTGVQMVTWPPSVVRGTVTWNGDSRHPPSLRVQATAMGEMPGGANAEVKADNTFELKVAAGRWQLRPLIGPVWRLRAVRAGGIDVTDTSFDVPINGTVENVEIELSDVVTQVTGTVIDAAGEKTRDTDVILFSTDPDRWTAQSRFFGASRPAPDMNFTMRVTPGEYLLAAVPSGVDRGRMFDPDFLGLLRESAVRLAIAEGEKKTVDLKLSEAPVR